ncbi:hypothetical protein [Nonomuraea sp. NPDC049141]|uniref:hypothetical protein n=1 Tax=Nonomuraea sp. NPDC049141 TaxID=3155500 RepID=UPI0033E6E273
MGRSPQERFAFEILELITDVGGYPYNYILRAPDGERRVLQTYISPTTWPSHFPEKWYRVGGRYVTTWKDWRHDYLPLRLWKQRLAEGDSGPEPVELWRCDVCDVIVREFGGDIEKALRLVNWGDWKRLDDGQGEALVMRCGTCVREHGTEPRKEETMLYPDPWAVQCHLCNWDFSHQKEHPDHDSAAGEAALEGWVYRGRLPGGKPRMRCLRCSAWKKKPTRNHVVSCWSCRKNFRHQFAQWIAASAVMEATEHGWAEVDGTVNGRPVSTPEHPQLRCPSCVTKSSGTAKPERRTTFHVMTVVSLAWAVVAEDGWVSAKDAEKLGKPGTAARVAAILKGEDRSRPKVTQEHVDLAHEAVAWIRARFMGPDIRGRTRFERLVWEAIHYDKRVNAESYSPDHNAAVPQNVVGLLATAPFVFREGQRRAAKKERWQSLKGSRPMGTLGGQLPATRMRVTHSNPANKTFPNPRNPTDSHTKTVHNYKLVDEHGNAYKWWGTDKVLAVGAEIHVKSARVTHYETYDGVTFTVITRCRIEDQMRKVS